MTDPGHRGQSAAHEAPNGREFGMARPGEPEPPATPRRTRSTMSHAVWPAALPTSEADPQEVTPATAPPFSASVRLATRAAHQRLEDTAVMRDLMAPNLTADLYASILIRWQHCWQPIEAALSAGLQRGMPAALMPARRLHLLERDLAFVQTRMLQTPAKAPPMADMQLGDLADTAHGWYGLAYVVQGSLLGGALVRTRLMKSLGLTGGHGTEFFAGGIAPQTLHLQWKAWLALADSLLQTPGAVQEAVEAANHSFSQMENVFSDEHPDHG